MQSATVECPHCQSNLEAPVSLHGSEVECPACKKSFVINIKQYANEKKSEVPSSTISFQPVIDLFSKSQNIFAGVSLLALVISIVALVIVLSSSGFPQLKISSDPADAVKKQLAFQVELNSIGEYFWRKNGDKILKSLDIKEIKTNGNWAVAFYKLSIGATEVKEAMFLYKTGDGHWLKVSHYTAEKKCQTNWYKDMKNRIDRFTKDSGEFDVLDL